MTAQWISQDPEGESAGDNNLYRCVKNNPTNEIDPSGMQGDVSRPKTEDELDREVQLGIFMQENGGRETGSNGGPPNEFAIALTVQRFLVAGGYANIREYRTAMAAKNTVMAAKKEKFNKDFAPVWAKLGEQLERERRPAREREQRELAEYNRKKLNEYLSQFPSEPNYVGSMQRGRLSSRDEYAAWATFYYPNDPGSAPPAAFLYSQQKATTQASGIERFAASFVLTSLSAPQQTGAALFQYPLDLFTIAYTHGDVLDDKQFQADFLADTINFALVVGPGMMEAEAGGPLFSAERRSGLAGASKAEVNVPGGSGLRRVGSRGVRNTAPLTAAQEAEIWQGVRDLGLNPSDVVIVGGPSRLVEFPDFNVIGIGPNAFPAARPAMTGSVFERLTPRGVVAHEAGHMITTRAGTSFAGGTLLDEFQASLVGRRLPGLNSTERFQLLRDAVERAKAAGAKPRDLLGQLRHTEGR